MMRKPRPRKVLEPCIENAFVNWLGGGSNFPPLKYTFKRQTKLS